MDVLDVVFVFFSVSSRTANEPQPLNADVCDASSGGSGGGGGGDGERDDGASQRERRLSVLATVRELLTTGRRISRRATIR